MNDLHHKPTNDPAKTAHKETRKKDLKVYLKFLLIYLCAATVGLLLCFTGSEGLMMLGEMVILIPGIFLLLLLPAILLSPQKRNTTEKNPQKNDTPKTEVPSAHKMTLEEEREYLGGMIQANPMRPGRSAMEKRLEEIAREMREQIFSNCGPMTKQLAEDTLKMNLQESFLKKAYVLPVSFGYQDGKYFVREPEDRGNQWITCFESEDGEAFRWRILEQLATTRGMECEPKERNASNETADPRIRIWEMAIRLLIRVYDIRDERMQAFIARRERLLQYRGAEKTQTQWKWDVGKMTFVDTSAVKKEYVFYYADPEKHRYPIWMKGKTVYTDPNCDTAGGNVPYLRIKEYPISEELIHDRGISREDLLEFLQSIGESIPSEIIPEWIPIE